MAPAGDLSLVDTVARGELQFFVPGVDLELFGSSRSGRSWAVALICFFACGACSCFPKGGSR